MVRPPRYGACPADPHRDPGDRHYRGHAGGRDRRPGPGVGGGLPDLDISVYIRPKVTTIAQDILGKATHAVAACSPSSKAASGRPVAWCWTCAWSPRLDGNPSR